VTEICGTLSVHSVPCDAEDGLLGFRKVTYVNGTTSLNSTVSAPPFFNLLWEFPSKEILLSGFAQKSMVV